MTIGSSSGTSSGGGGNGGSGGNSSGGGGGNGGSDNSGSSNGSSSCNSRAKGTGRGRRLLEAVKDGAVAAHGRGVVHGQHLAAQARLPHRQRQLHGGRAPLRLLGERVEAVGAVVASVAVRSAAVQLQHLVAHGVQKVAVVRHLRASARECSAASAAAAVVATIAAVAVAVAAAKVGGGHGHALALAAAQRRHLAVREAHPQDLQQLLCLARHARSSGEPGTAAACFATARSYSRTALMTGVSAANTASSTVRLSRFP
eukprot:jgi/Mesen1/9387/ME000613S08758